MNTLTQIARRSLLVQVFLLAATAVLFFFLIFEMTLGFVYGFGAVVIGGSSGLFLLSRINFEEKNPLALKLAGIELTKLAVSGGVLALGFLWSGFNPLGLLYGFLGGVVIQAIIPLFLKPKTGAVS